MKVNARLRPEHFARPLEQFWNLSREKIEAIERTADHSKGAPVFTIRGRYTSRSWTEWTEGFRFGSALLQFDATGDESCLEIGRRGALDRMARHVTDAGVHDHGFTIVSTFGNLRRLMNEGRIPEDRWERAFYELALRASGATQARRWTGIAGGGGFVHSFNGPHSLFVDTIRTLRALALAHLLGQTLMGEGDCPVSLLARLAAHALATARYSVYYGKGRDRWDVRGRVAHESIFNVTNGEYRCPNSQQGYSPFSTWTRGLAWAICGFAEQIEFLSAAGDRQAVGTLGQAARATADFYIDQATAADGIPYWDTGAPGLGRLGDWRARPAEPFNDHEPVDSSAATIAAQGLLRLGHHLGKAGGRYWQAGLTVLHTLLGEPYLSTDRRHQGLVLHSVYHRPKGWDYVPQGRAVPCGESSMWGDYHAREAALYVQRIARGEPYLTFFG